MSKIPFLHTLLVLNQIEALEKNGKLSEARKLRRHWLKKPTYARVGTLWASEAADLLFNEKNAALALPAYEKALATKTINMADPLGTFYGAACAALVLNHQSKANLYHDKFNHQWDAWMNDPDLKGYCFTHYLGCKNFLDKHVPAIKH